MVFALSCTDISPKLQTLLTTSPCAACLTQHIGILQILQRMLSRVSPLLKAQGTVSSLAICCKSNVQPCKACFDVSLDKYCACFDNLPHPTDRTEA